MVDDKSRKRLPPYISYRTFRNFVDGLQQQMPARIDRSYWGDMLGGSSGTQLMAAMRFMGLIDTNGRPTDRLRPLVSAKGEQRPELLREIANKAFDFVLQGSFDLQNATYAQLQENFHDNFQLTGEVSRKCIKFFIGLAADAGIPLSPFITKRFRPTHIGTGTKIAIKRTASRVSRNAIIPQFSESIPDRSSWEEMILDKFPKFDPAWSDEVKLNWFKAFDELLKRGLTKAEK